MFKRLIKKLYFKAFPYAADIGKDDLRDLSVELNELKDNIQAYERQEISRQKLKAVCYESIEFVSVDMIPTIESVEVFEKYLRKNFAHKLEPEIAKRFIIEQDKALSNPIITAFRARIKFYVEDKEEG